VAVELFKYQGWTGFSNCWTGFSNCWTGFSNCWTGFSNCWTGCSNSHYLTIMSRRWVGGGGRPTQSDSLEWTIMTAVIDMGSIPIPPTFFFFFFLKQWSYTASDHEVVLPR
jgi:hypothetical protein